jgi:hypothetical protein
MLRLNSRVHRNWWAGSKGAEFLGDLLRKVTAAGQLVIGFSPMPDAQPLSYSTPPSGQAIRQRFEAVRHPNQIR